MSFSKKLKQNKNSWHLTTLAKAFDNFGKGI
jgi:hypothetical protein